MKKQYVSSPALLATALLVLTGFVSSLRAQETEAQAIALEDALPSETILYADVSDIQKNLGGIREQFYSALSESQKETFNARKDELMETVSSAVEKTSGFNPMNLLSHVTRVRIAVPGMNLDVSKMSGRGEVPLKNASFVMALSVDRSDVFSQLFSGKLAERMEKEETVNSYTIYRIQTPENKDEDVPEALYALQRGRQLFLALDRSRLVALAEGAGSEHLPDAALSKNEKYTSSRDTAGGGMLFVHANLDSLWTTLKSSLDRKPTEIYQKLSSSLGFEEMKSAFLSVHLEGDLASMSAGVNMSGEEFPLYDLMKTEPGKLELVSSIPSDAFLGTVSAIPDFRERWPAIKSKIIEIMKKFSTKEDRAKQQWEMMTMMFQKQMNVGLGELLGQFGDEMAFYLTPPSGDTAAGGEVKPDAYAKQIVLTLKLKDGEKTKTLFTEQIRSAPGYKQLKNMEQQEEHNDTTLYTYQSPGAIEPTIFFQNDRLVFAGSPDLARKLIDGTGDGKSVADNDWYRAVRKNLPEELSGIQFTDTKEYARFITSLQSVGGTGTANVLTPDLTVASGSPSGGLTGTVTTADQIRISSVSRLDFSSLDGEKVNAFLKKKIEELKNKLEEGK